uniref:(northern house mosquito) hypothetical protein n=1 Tax=Culex pipiens TaxID=7175 RepID=A0A8D8P4E3_CULPI
MFYSKPCNATCQFHSYNLNNLQPIWLNRFKYPVPVWNDSMVYSKPCNSTYQNSSNNLSNIFVINLNRFGYTSSNNRYRFAPIPCFNRIYKLLTLCIHNFKVLFTPIPLKWTRNIKGQKTLKISTEI